MNDLVKRPTMVRPTDSLSEISDIITERLGKWETFDLDVCEEQLSAVERVIKARDLEWRHMDGDDEPFVYDGVATIVVGVLGSDFEDHEARR